MLSINYLAVAVAGIAGWFAGAGWYGVLGNQWLAALGWTKADIAGPDGKPQMPMGPMVLSVIANLIMALMLAGVVAHIVPRPTPVAGAVSGALVWFGFVVTTMAVNNAFAKRTLALTLIDGGHWLMVLVVQGVVLGLFG
jgi:Protein of unknown function (DUF1761)